MKNIWSIILFCCVALMQLEARAGRVIDPASKQPDRHSTPAILRKFQLSVKTDSESGKVVIIQSKTSAHLQFYLYDTDGKMLNRLNLRGYQKQSINNLSKGVYSYDVFANDESIEQGQITIP